MAVKLILSDPSEQVVEAWKAQFVKWPEVEVRSEDILQTQADAFLLPGSSFGFLDRGLELRVVETYGWEVQDQLRATIRGEFEGELLVGQALVLRVPSMPRPLVYAPLWRTPRSLDGTVHVFLALRGAFLAIKRDAARPAIETLAVPAVGVAPPASLDPRISARQIRHAYEMAAGHRGLGDKNLSQITRREHKLQSIPGAGKEEDDGA